MGFLETLTIVFVVLKLLGHIAWSWGWVLAPLWISLGFYALTFGVIVLVAVLGGK